jgi:Na+/proline symporter
MTKTSAFAKSVIIGTSFGASLWAIIFLLEPSEYPISFWLRTGWFWAGVTRGALAGWILGVMVGAIIVSVLAIKSERRRTEEESH